MMVLEVMDGLLVPAWMMLGQAAGAAAGDSGA